VLTTSTTPLRSSHRAVLIGLFGVVVALACPGNLSAQSETAAQQAALDLDDGWKEVDPTGQAQRRFTHPSGATIQIIVIEAREDDTIRDEEGNSLPLTGTLIVEDWDTQFIDGGPLVETVRHGRESHGGVEGLFGELVWNERRGMYFGFSSADLASAHGAPLSRDRHAFFVLCEGPDDQERTTETLCRAVYERLTIDP